MMVYRTLWTTAVVSLFSVASAGCSGTIYKRSTLGDLETLSVDARQRLTFVGLYYDHRGEPRRALCTEPSPDAAVARAESLAAAATSPVAAAGGATSLGTVAAGIGGSSSEAIASLSARTQTLQLLRDGYFRACEGLLNGVIDRNQYEAILANVDSTMIALAAVDALGSGATQAPGVAITAGGASTTSPVEGANVVTNAGDGSSTPLVVQNTFPSRSQVAPEQAMAIQAIALQALRNAQERQRYLRKRRATMGY